ncbi:cAMP-specific 3',5'-cyclic phosphodiesterase 4D [Kappamyces sp. JEL0680]|nr:cAMP-specific 3',5'-cyclic phosphodiesterase 4D [Kappamyces sp. JEL0680]
MQSPGPSSSSGVNEKDVIVDVKKDKGKGFPSGDAIEDHASLLSRYLSFKLPDLESEFSSYFINLNLLRWRRTISSMFIILSFLYVYLIAKNTMDWVYWRDNYQDSWKVANGTSNAFSPGVYKGGNARLKCDPNIICKDYDPVYDASFWFTTVLIPYVLALVTCYNSKQQTFAESIDKVTSAMALVQILAGVGIRFYVIEAQQNFLQPTLIMIVMTMLCFIGTRTRFVYTLATTGSILVIWLIMNVAAVAVPELLIPNSGGDYGIGLICAAIASGMVMLCSYETEHFYKIQFLMSKEMKKNNAKLKNQLNLLAKSYNQQAVKSLDSPLERSMMVIRSVMADPCLISRHLLALGQVTSLLASSNLLTPDFEGTVAESMDNEQQAWLFSEIAARRRKGRGKSNYRRRISVGEGQKNARENVIVEEDGAAPVVSITAAQEVDNAANPGLATQETDRRFSKSSPQDKRAIYPPEIDEIAQILSRYNDYDFNLFELANLSGNRSLYLLSHHLFFQAKLFDLFVIPLDKFSNCIAAIESGYHADLPYHNSIHATDVLHCIHTLANSAKIKDIWSDIELLAMYFAAIIHDHDHPGLTNNYLVTTSDPKATLYNDKAVLENHHCASSFVTLARPENNFLAHLTKAEFKSIREVVVDLVASPETYDPYENRDDRMLLYKIMIKCSDVSNPTKDLSIYKPWCRLITAEFFSQGDMEKKLNIPVSPYMDRENPNAPGSQIGFIDYVVQPLFGALDSYQPIPSILNKLAKNREYWYDGRGINAIGVI